MSIISLLNVNVLNNPANFMDKYQFEITFECLEQLSKDLEFKLTYVGSATSSEHDQELDSLFVGPIPVGVNKFIFEADPPNLSRIPSSEILGVTVLLLTAAYDGREFVRVGYYTNNEYDSEEMNKEPPNKPAVERIVRNVLAEKPRVTRFAIKWDTEDSEPPEFPPDQPEADLVPDDEDQYAADELAAEGDGEVEPGAMDEDIEMDGAEELVKDDDEISNDGSEDLEAESAGSDDEDDDDEDEAMDVSAEDQLHDEATAVSGPSGAAGDYVIVG
ncbi:histone deposition protein Asf1 [Terfezia boudieri ATCC MYA-4762]|uniref:Histone chaperone n=1 Tax=Terfezia boudieri ATCC MYA-4762 TaxID=1051890 RepID=A0A3N4M5K0_9PEZI|nr:histone deposition protein Asf1 [Terfezia boudieri ATCC MYA-4762]